MLFVNRVKELEVLDDTLLKGGVAVIYGRRRIGKSALIDKWSESNRVIISQAIEATPSLQISQLANDLVELLPEGVTPKSFDELLALLSLYDKECTVVFDEFPYLVDADRSVPSILQKWLDRKKKNNMSIAILGSSQSSMHSIFLNASSPLFGRADITMQIKPMGYKYFCLALDIDPKSKASFVKYSMVGGIPKYWNYVRQEDSIVKTCEKLFFDEFAQLQDEPDKILKDESVTGRVARATLEAIGRGAHKPSEISSRMEIPQNTLAKTFRLLQDTSLIKKEVPFGEPEKNQKKSLYKISDYSLRFWFEVYSTWRVRWKALSSDAKTNILNQYASKILEDSFLTHYDSAARYWEGSKLELDSVRYHPSQASKIIISELKWDEQSGREKDKLEGEIREKFRNSALAKKFTLSEVEVLGLSDVLKRIS